MNMSKKREDKDSVGLPGVAKGLLKLNGGGGCCGDIKIVEVEEEAEKTEDKAEKTEDKAGTTNEGD